jgi:uncharacterized protein YgbK (DUF1537 family)
VTTLTPSSMLLPLVVFADDLTGAMDSGLQFALRGYETQLWLSPGVRTDASVVALSSESRELSPSDAIARVHGLASVVAGRRVFKKVDSTLRGNVGYELRVLLSDLAVRAAVVAPSFPQGGRTLVDGQLLVNGLPLALTAFRSDPRWPMAESNVALYLMQQSGLEVSRIALGAVRQGRDALAGAIASSHTRLLVVDATTEADLHVIAAAVSALGPDWMPCGSAGLANAWACLLEPGVPPAARFAGHRNRGALFVVGSRNPVTLAQLECLSAAGAVKVTLDRRGIYEPQREIGRLATAVSAVLAAGSDAILDATSAPLIPGSGERVADTLAQVVNAVQARGLIGALLLSGGEVAMAVCRAMRVESLRILDEIEAGIPGGVLVGGPASGTPVVTKAGGFGSPDALVAGRDWLHNAGTVLDPNDSPPKEGR